MLSNANIKSVELWIALFSLLCAITFACLALLMCLLYARKSARCRALEERLEHSNTNNTSASIGGYTLPQSQATSSRSHPITNEYDVNSNDPSDGVTASSGLTSQDILSRASVVDPTYATPDDNFLSSVSAPEKEPSLGLNTSKVEICTQVASGFASSRVSGAMSMSVCSASETRQAVARSRSRLGSSHKQKPQSSPPPPPSEEIASTSEMTYEDLGPGIELTQFGESAASSAAAAAITPSTGMSGSAKTDCQC